MATLETLTVADLKQVMNSKSLKKARGYVEGVRQAVRNGRTLHAEVGKNRIYHVEVDVLESGIHAACSCPYDWGGYCKHIGALLLKWIEQPDSFVIEMPASTNPNAIIETYSVNAPETAVPPKKPYWMQKSFQKRCQDDDDNLRIWLNEYKIQELRQIAKKHDWPLKGNRKADLIQQIMSYLQQPGVLLKSLLGLDAEHRQVFDALGLLYPGIRFQIEHAAALALHWGSLKLYKKVDTYITRLCDAGLAIPGNFDYHFWQQIAFIPNSILRALPPLLTDRIPAAALSNEMDSGMLLGQARPFLQRAHQILLLLEQSQPPLRQPLPRPRLEKFHEILRGWDYIPEEIREAQQKNQLAARDPKFNLTVPPPRPALTDETIQRLSPIAGDEIQLNFIYHLLLTAGLLQPGSPVTAWREVKEQFLRQNEASQWAILVQSYFVLMTWSELWLMVAERPSLQLKRSQNRNYRAMPPEAMYEMLTAMRAQVVQVLAALPDDRWFNLHDITDLLHTFWPRFDSLAWSPVNYYRDMQPDWFLVEDGRSLDTTNNKADWHKAQGAFVRQIIQGPLHWLGLADISMEYGRLTAFRLHGLGDLFLDKVESVPLADSTTPQQKTAVSAQPVNAITIEETTIIVEPTAVSAQAHNYLDGIAILTEASTHRFVYQLSAAAIHQALEDGQTLNELLKGWEKWLAIPMPKPIHEQITAWHKAYGRARLYENITIIEFGDEYALAEMKAATSLEKHLIAEISPTLVIIPAKSVEQLAAELEKAGYTPKKTDGV
ncbi:MAG: helicase-associated domain-containing protein [Ardenticatenaceae bacterium]|nr:helicase-associated domain-containing protein [Ardenticatenaceae bacterium]